MYNIYSIIFSIVVSSKFPTYGAYRSQRHVQPGPAQPRPWPRGLPDFVQPAVEPMVYGAMTQAGAKVVVD